MGVLLTHVRLYTVWGGRNVTQPTLKSLPETGSLQHLVIVFHVGVVIDEIMRSVVGTLEDIQQKHIHSVTFTFSQLGSSTVPKEAVNILPVVVAKMREHLGSHVVINAKWLGIN